MTALRDFEGRVIRLTDERLTHIQEHPEMSDLEAVIVETVARPACVVQSVSDPQAHLYYRWYVGTRVGNKYLCVVVRSSGMTPSFSPPTSPTRSRRDGGYGQ